MTRSLSAWLTVWTIVSASLGSALAASRVGDDRFVVEQFRALACGHIHQVQHETANVKGGRKTTRIVVSRKEAEAIRPDITEIIVFTGLRTRGGR